MKETDKKGSLTRRQVLRNAAIATAAVTIPGGYAYLEAEARRRSRQTQHITSTDIQMTPITELHATATARQDALNNGRIPEIFYPEHGFVEEDYQRIKQATFRLHFHNEQGLLYGGGTGWAVTKSTGELVIVTNKHVTEAIERLNEPKVHLSIDRPGMDRVSMKGTQFAYTNHRSRDLATIHWQPQQKEYLEAIEPLPYEPNARISEGEWLMILGYPSALTEIAKFTNGIENIPNNETQTSVEYVQVINTLKKFRKVLNRNIIPFQPWRNSAGGSGSSMARKTQDGNLSIIGTFSGLTASYKDIFGYEQKLIPPIGLGWKLDTM